MSRPISQEKWRTAISNVLTNAQSNTGGSQQAGRDGGADRLAPLVTWEHFTSNFDWNQHEHIGMIGPTGRGKTTLALQILDMRRYITVLGTKPKDPVLDTLKQGKRFYHIKTWKDWDPELVPRRLLWPDATDLYSARKQQAEFRKAFHGIYYQGGWCVYVDELWYVIHHLKLELEIRTFLQQARSLKVSLVLLTQRPAFVPLEVYDQSTHLFFWGDNDETNLRRISGISYRSAHLVRDIVSQLERHQVLYVNTRTGEMMRFTPPKIELPED
jgi:hypothetical protein